MKNLTPNILVFGVSIMDIFGFVDRPYKSHDSIPGVVQTAHGGVCRNIAENLTRIGINTKFISVLGDDPSGLAILHHADQIGLDMHDSLIVEGATTPTYMAILDEHREMISAVVDMKIIPHMTPAFIDTKAHLIEAADYMIMDCDCDKLVQHIVTTYQGKTNFILDPVSGTKARAVKHLLPYFHTIKPNRHEAEALCGFPLTTFDDIMRAGHYFLEQGVKNVFISLDKDGVYYCSANEEGIIKGSPIDVVNVTGAGDSFVAGIGFGYMHNASIEQTLKFAIAMSIATITHEHTIHPEVSVDFIHEIINNQVWTHTQIR